MGNRGRTGAGDVQVAADTLDRTWLDLYSGGQATTLLGWIDRLPRETVLEYPALVLARGGVARAMGRVEEAEPWFALAEQAAQRVTSEEERDEIVQRVRQDRYEQVAADEQHGAEVGPDDAGQDRAGAPGRPAVHGGHEPAAEHADAQGSAHQTRVASLGSQSSGTAGRGATVLSTSTFSPVSAASSSDSITSVTW